MSVNQDWQVFQEEALKEQKQEKSQAMKKKDPEWNQTFWVFRHGLWNMLNIFNEIKDKIKERVLACNLSPFLKNQLKILELKENKWN